MAIANPLKSGSTNTISIYDKDFNTSGWNRIELTKNVTCQKFVASIDGVFICNNTTNLTFNLPCLEKGNYKLELFETGSISPTYTLTAIVY